MLRQIGELFSWVISDGKIIGVTILGITICMQNAVKVKCPLPPKDTSLPSNLQEHFCRLSQWKELINTWAALMHISSGRQGWWVRVRTHTHTYMHQLVSKILLSLYETSDIFLNITDYTSTSLPCILECGGEGGKEVQHDKAKATRKKVICGILFYFYRSVSDFGKIC